MRNPSEFVVNADEDEEAVLAPAPPLTFLASQDVLDQTGAPPVKAATSRKRKTPGDIALSDDSTTVAIAPVLVPTAFESPSGQRFYATRAHPINKSGFRYIPCGPAPCYSSVYPMYRAIESPPAGHVRFSWEDRSSYSYLSEDALSVMTEKGFRAARTNVALRQGTWYFEFIIEAGGGDSSSCSGIPSHGAHVRIGIGRRESSVNAPVGIDGYSYGIRDKTGERVTLSQPTQYGEPFKSGDVIGVLVHLPPRDPPKHVADDTIKAHHIDPADPSVIVRKRVPIRYKGQLYYESLEYIPSKEMNDMAEAISDSHFGKPKLTRQKAAAPGQKYRPLPSELAPPPRPIPKLFGSYLYFFKNGQPMGEKINGREREPAFESLFDFLPLRQHAPSSNRKRHHSVADRLMAARENHNDDGTLGYYPIASVYGGGIVRLHAGPDWKCPPVASPSLSKVGKPSSWRPLSARYAEALQEELALDEIEERVAEPAIAEAMREADQEAMLYQVGPTAKLEKTKSRDASVPVTVNTAVTKSEPQTPLEILSSNAASPASVPSMLIPATEQDSSMLATIEATTAAHHSGHMSYDASFLQAVDPSLLDHGDPHVNTRRNDADSMDINMGVLNHVVDLGHPQAFNMDMDSPSSVNYYGVDSPVGESFTY